MDAQALPQTWFHSYEEDTSTEMVFRPAGWSFPRSRGRRGFALKTDGTASIAGIGATDRPSSASGRWVFEDPDRLMLYEGDSGQPSRVYHVISVSPDRLVVQKASLP